MGSTSGSGSGLGLGLGLGLGQLEQPTLEVEARGDAKPADEAHRTWRKRDGQQRHEASAEVLEGRGQQQAAQRRRAHLARGRVRVRARARVRVS